jgi:Flp pilus assembly protein TadG
MSISRLLNKSKSRKSSENGQSLIEFAVLFPVFLLMLAGIVEFGFIFRTSHTLQQATREGARYAITLEDLTVNDSRVDVHTQSFVPSESFYSGFSTTTNTAVTDCLTNDQVTVTVSGSYNFIALNVLGLSSLNLSFPTTMRALSCD